MAISSEGSTLRCLQQDCVKSQKDGSIFCDEHSSVAKDSKLADWVRDLPYAVGSGVAGSVVYDVLKVFTETTMLTEDSSGKANSILAELEDPDLTETGLANFSNFITDVNEPYFCEQLDDRFANSEGSELFSGILQKD